MIARAGAGPMSDYAAHMISSRVSRMRVYLVVLTVASLLSLSWTGRCPPSSGIVVKYCVDTVTVFISAPNFTPTNLTVLHKNATSITINWTAVDATDADGYVIQLLEDDDTLCTTNRTAVDVGNTTQYTFRAVISEHAYSITVRAYQDLLGPESYNISETFVGEKKY